MPQKQRLSDEVIRDNGGRFDDKHARVSARVLDSDLNQVWMRRRACHLTSGEGIFMLIPWNISDRSISVP
jgi:hypothetical protein